MEIVITYDKVETEDYTKLGGDVERTWKSYTEVYTLPIVALARVESLTSVGIKCVVKNVRTPIIVCE